MVLISKCCVGVKCRYRHNGFWRKFVAEVGEVEDFIAVCPEMLGGLPLPREGCNVTKSGQVVGRRTRKDYTTNYQYGAQATLEICQRNGIKCAYLLKNSPSCGAEYGLTAKLLAAHGIEIIPV